MDSTTELPMWTRISLIGSHYKPPASFVGPHHLTGGFIELDKWPDSDKLAQALASVDMSADGEAGAVIHDEDHATMIACYHLFNGTVAEISDEKFTDLWGFTPEEWM